MVTEEEARALALAMPAAQEQSHMGHADFRVGGRIFGGFPKPGQMSLRLDPVEQAAVVGERPATFTAAAGAWGRQGWTLVELASADSDELRELVIEAWRWRAPRRMVEEYDAGGA